MIYVIIVHRKQRNQINNIKSQIMKKLATITGLLALMLVVTSFTTANKIGGSKPPVGEYTLAIGGSKPPVGEFTSNIGGSKPPVGEFTSNIGGSKPPVGE